MTFEFRNNPCRQARLLAVTMMLVMLLAPLLPGPVSAQQRDLPAIGGLGGGLPLVPRFREGDDAVRYVSSARDVEAVLEDVGEVVPPPAPVVEE